ncbi:hypothetical protein JCM11641_007128 [Rhodosporidiobolus odoratus]
MPLPGVLPAKFVTRLSVLVTGSGRGIGRSEAIAFAQAGASKIVLTSRSTGELEEVKKTIDALGKGTEVVIVQADATDETSVDDLFEKAGEVDVLINDAGALEPVKLIRDSNPAVWNKTNTINTYGTYLATRAFLRAVHAKGLVNGSSKKLTVINTSSIGSVGTRPGFSAYQPGKRQINRFTEFLYFEEPAVRTFAIHLGGPLTSPARFRCRIAERQRSVSDAILQDVDELVLKKDEILAKDLLWTRVVGQEQTIPK